MLNVLRLLGQRCSESEIVVVGGAAGVLCEWTARATSDIDVIFAEPKLSALTRELAQIAEEHGLPDRWLNDGARAFINVLPPDFRDRLVLIGEFGGLRVSSVGRVDFILLKVFAMRAVDIQDVESLQPTAAEIDFVRTQLPRIAQFDERRAHLMELYLDQGASS